MDDRARRTTSRTLTQIAVLLALLPAPAMAQTEEAPVPPPTEDSRSDAESPAGADAYVGAKETQPGAETGEEKTALARAELVSFQTLHGLGVGLEACAWIGCWEPRLMAGTLMATGGAGLGVSLLASRGGVTPGMTASLNSGATWGFWHGMAVTHMIDIQGRPVQGGALIAGQGLGMGAGALAHSLWKPTAGQVSQTTSGAFWANIYNLWIWGMLEFDAPPEIGWSTVFAATNVGMVTGGLLAAHVPMSRSRSLVIDSGGVVGSLVGLGLPLLIAGDAAGPMETFGGALVGTTVGLGASTFLTRNWDRPDDESPVRSVQLAVAPSTDGEGATLTVGGRF